MTVLKNFPSMEVRDSFQCLKASLNELVASLASQSPDFPCWVATPDDEPRQGKDAIMWIYQQLFYQPYQDKRATLTRPGFLATTSETIVLAHDVNACKQRFQKAMQAVKRRDERLSLSMELFDEVMRNPGQAETLRRAGLGTLHLKQAYRQIPILQWQPRRLGFSWSKGSRSVERLTKEQAMKAAMRASDSTAALTILEELPDDAFVARVRSHSPHVRTNIVFSSPHPKKQIPSSLPILYPSNSMTAPLYTKVPFNADDVDVNRLPREQLIINYDEPVLINAEGTIGLYLYK